MQQFFEIVQRGRNQRPDQAGRVLPGVQHNHIVAYGVVQPGNGGNGHAVPAGQVEQRQIGGEYDSKGGKRVSDRCAGFCAIVGIPSKIRGGVYGNGNGIIKNGGASLVDEINESGFAEYEQR